MWRAVKGVFGGDEKEKAGKEETAALKNKEVVVEIDGKGNVRYYGETAAKGEEKSEIVRTEIDLPINSPIASNSQKKLAFLLDNVQLDSMNLIHILSFSNKNMFCPKLSILSRL